ncbi:hypothetical protein [Desulforudis sp. DRI-14]|uniref:hypothetical protein n=1 Tax=Desulforudis sp. DRI-14 TaxID=3459793 RepID=UPI003BC42189
MLLCNCTLNAIERTLPCSASTPSSAEPSTACRSPGSNTFLVICHSIVEDTLLFAALGANLAIILGWRFVLAVFVCLVLSRILKVAREMPCAA